MAVGRDIPKWQLPQAIEYRIDEKKALAVFFLCPLDESEIGEVCKKIVVIDESWTERPDGELWPVVPVPWIHSQTPPLSSIFDIRGSVFIDEESMRTDTAIVVQSVGDPDSRVARVPLGRVNLIAQSLMSREIPFSELVSPSAIISIEQTQADPLEPAAQQSHVPVYALPAHLPRHLKIEPLTLTLISLVYLSEDETTRLKATVTMSEQISDVVIYNWPDEENPCSREDLYRLFSQLELDIHAGCDEIYALFIDRKCDGSYQILRAQKYICKFYQGVIDDLKEQFIDLRDLKEPRLAADFWHMMWNPWPDGKNGDSWNSSRASTRLYNNQVAMLGNYAEIVPNPDKLVMGLYHPIFVLSPMTDADLRLIRSYIMREAETADEWCLYNVSKKLESPDIGSLMQWFNESTESPSYFMAVDSTTLKIARSAMSQVQSLKRGKIDPSRALLIASDEPIRVEFNDDESCNAYAEVRLGYAYARQSADDAFSTCTNLSLANMYFHECVEIEDEETWEYVDEWLESNPVIDELEEYGPAIVSAGAYYPGEQTMRKPKIFE
ncbi:hypothetical protein TMatcc_006415 [Talaromyces marneffei ATCC 18224]|uniref:Uncharacterized protein n=1 Tax=Talaromyces marneffei (strain ATCC 18224 / CBS 334.59 / QM 7333) TaxID=441960 RepID=B6QB20_TALMQ|nr:uncharacterized protein EYB26_002644 [Talaromyces marneffei]EEA25361.1 hypothetical protein PMAA_064720 [Talaromyces marneffei ATCC 18224]KAE8554090.1 hypothetical protein EYB25_002628 [Talaromyces marneffei]QGA14988.1 hypothetical protein EYB26_002644 [Talaromyces marneffei]